LEKQGYIIKQNTFYQDNQSRIQFETNGRKSCGTNSKHIDMQYFFIKDRLEIEGFNVEYCPKEEMLADFFTQPLQGNLFRRLREVIVGRKHIDTLKEFTSAKSQESDYSKISTNDGGFYAAKPTGVLDKVSYQWKMRLRPTYVAQT
jgi:hypothetical protein